jgi:hypothetical protein
MRWLIVFFISLTLTTGSYASSEQQQQFDDGVTAFNAGKLGSGLID